MVRLFFDLLLIVSIVTFAVPYAVRAGLNPAFVGTAFVALAFIVALGRSRGMRRVVGLTFRIALPLAALTGLILTYGGEQWPVVIGPVLTLVAVLFGIYVMFAGVFGGRSRR